MSNKDIVKDFKIIDKLIKQFYDLSFLIEAVNPIYKTGLATAFNYAFSKVVYSLVGEYKLGVLGEKNNKEKNNK